MKHFMVSRESSKSLLYIIFFFSGISGLIYELVWIRELSLVFGRTILATSVVVSVYMAGLGFGSAFWGAYIDKKGHDAFKTFGMLQLGIGISCSAIIVFLYKMPLLYKFFFSALSSSYTASFLLIFLLSFLTMLVPTFLMGGTLPVISKIIITGDREIGSGIGGLYAVNTLGGILGAGLTGYVLLGALGHFSTQLLAVVINLALGCITFSVSSAEKKSPPEHRVKTPARAYAPRIIRFALPAALITGFCSLAYEILCTRALSIFLVSSAYSFSSILIVFLSGISLGSFLFTRFLKDKNLLLTLSVAQSLIGFYSLIIVAVLNSIPVLLFPINGFLAGLPVLKIFVPGILLSGILLLIPALLMGISFPILCTLYTSDINFMGKNIGRVYFLNTIGSIIGPLCAGFILIPLLGVSWGISIIALISLALGTALACIDTGMAGRQRLILGNTLLIIIGAFLINHGTTNSTIHPPSIYRAKAGADAILYYKETSEGTVTVREDKTTGVRTLYVNNNAVCGATYDAVMVVKMLGHLPFLINPFAQDVLVIGFGIGITTAEIAKHLVKKIDCVEICPGVKEGAGYFSAYNNNIVANPKLNFISGDGRSHLLLTDTRYDVISCDPTHPTLGCGNLYSREYFLLCKNHLKENGVVTQYLPLHKIATAEFKSIVKTFASVFPNSSVWLGHSHCILLGAEKQYTIDFRFLTGFLEVLNDNILNDPYLVATSLFLDEKDIKAFTGKSEIHTDNRPFLDFFSPYSMRKENWHLNFMEMLKYRTDPTKHFVNIENPETMKRYLQAQEYYFHGLINKSKGDMNKAAELFRLANSINPENKEIKMLLDDALKNRPGR